MGNLLGLFTSERLPYDHALHASSHACKLLISKEMVGRVDLNLYLVIERFGDSRENNHCERLVGSVRRECLG